MKSMPETKRDSKAYSQETQPNLLPIECPGCSGTTISEAHVQMTQPVVLNYRFGSPDEAASVPIRDISLRQCARCGLIFNAAIDPGATPYDEGYENRQTSSPLFRAMMMETAQHLADRYKLSGGMILEVGCGKGDFLRMLCETAGADGRGYDTSYSEGDVKETNGVKFFKRYVSADDIQGNVDCVVCRHVIEHVPAVGEFLRTLTDIARAGSTKVVYLETPSWDWIAENAGYWDVVYEHCNYIPMQTLRSLVEVAGMEVLEHRSIFGGQYQAIEARPSYESQGSSISFSLSDEGSLAKFASKIAAVKAKQVEALIGAGAAEGWAIWGAGAKGAALANAFNELPPTIVVDVNPAKQGSFIPGTSIPVVPPNDKRLSAVKAVMVANPNYMKEIGAMLVELSVDAVLLEP